MKALPSTARRRLLHSRRELTTVMGQAGTRTRDEITGARPIAG
jgi:hypothetical protein